MVKRGRGRPRIVASDNLINHYQLPEFFQIYVPSLCSERMKIPPAFIKKFERNIPTNVTLRCPTGQSWQVNISKTSEHWYFEQGWPKFVRETSLEDGDFLTFCYVGDSIFSAKVFGMMNGCRKSVEVTSTTDGNETSEPENSKQHKASRRNLSVKSSISRKSICRSPSFTISMTKSYISKGCMHIPVDFSNMYMRKNGRVSEMATIWINNESWPLSLISDSTDGVRFSRGWTKFAKDNYLKNGNLCTFQLIDRRDQLAFKVTISR